MPHRPARPPPAHAPAEIKVSKGFGARSSRSTKSRSSKSMPPSSSFCVIRWRSSLSICPSAFAAAIMARISSMALFSLTVVSDRSAEPEPVGCIGVLPCQFCMALMARPASIPRAPPPRAPLKPPAGRPRPKDPPHLPRQFRRGCPALRRSRPPQFRPLNQPSDFCHPFRSRSLPQVNDERPCWNSLVRRISIKRLVRPCRCRRCPSANAWNHSVDPARRPGGPTQRPQDPVPASGRRWRFVSSG